jgi:hypothetical protein
VIEHGCSSSAWESETVPFNERFHTLTKAYYIWERDARVGGTVTYGPPRPFFESVGPEARLPGLSDSFGIVNYTAYQTTDKSYLLTFRTSAGRFSGGSDVHQVI